MDRKNVLKILAGTPLLGGLIGQELFAKGEGPTYAPDYRNYMQELGVPVIINARGHNTVMTGSIMLPEVMAAINATSNEFVEYEVLMDRVGERIAHMIGCEAATVTSGAASAMTLGTAACITGTDQELISQLPSLPGPQKEVIVQKTHRFPYDHAVRNTGIKYVEVENRRDFERAVNRNTVMALFFNRQNDNGQIKHEEFVELCQKHNIPSLNDCAAELPPVDNLWRFTDMGFDLVAFSGGKEIRGPQSAGLLLGRKDLIQAARAQSSPKADTIGRGMKVNKEEIVGMCIAVETYLQTDHERVKQERYDRLNYVRDYIMDIPSVEQEFQIKENSYVGQVDVPVLVISWDQSVIRRTPGEMLEALHQGKPSIIVGGGRNNISVNLRMERPGTEKIVARRIHDELMKGRA